MLNSNFKFNILYIAYDFHNSSTQFFLYVSLYFMWGVQRGKGMHNISLIGLGMQFRVYLLRPCLVHIHIWTSNFFNLAYKFFVHMLISKDKLTNFDSNNIKFYELIFRNCEIGGFKYVGVQDRALKLYPDAVSITNVYGNCISTSLLLAFIFFCTCLGSMRNQGFHERVDGLKSLGTPTLEVNLVYCRHKTWICDFWNYKPFSGPKLM